MNILLINPPRDNEVIGNNPIIIEKNRGVNPPLGILYVAAYIEKYSNHKISVLDCQVESLNYEQLQNRIKKSNPDIVGLTAMSLTLLDVIQTAKIVKETNKDIRVVLGGPHVHLFPEETICLPNIDFLVLGEGEIVFMKLIDHIKDTDALESIKGIVFKTESKIVNTGLPEPIKQLDDLPFPARHLVPYKNYRSLLTKGQVVTTIFTSRGCPFKCSFCDRPHLGKKFRARSALNVVEELQQCKEMGISDFLFYDDTFTVNKQRVLDICNEVCKKKLDINWDIRTRVDTIDEEMIIHLKKAGCRSIHYGIEAGTEKILKILNKGITLEQAKKTFDLTRKHKMNILAYFMIGNPDESREDIYTTYKVMKKLKPDYVHITILTPFPGTKIYKDGLLSGIIKNDYWKAFAKKPSDDFNPLHINTLLSKSELNQLLRIGYKKFYLRPFYIFNQFLKVRSLTEFLKKMKAGLSVASMK